MTPEIKAESWREKWQQKEISAEKAIKHINPGNRVFISTGCALPQTLAKELARQARSLTDVQIIHYLTLSTNGPYAHYQPTPFRHNTFFVNETLREMVRLGKADYTPVMASQISALFLSGRINIDVALVQLSPPDEFGYCSLGIGVDFAKEIVGTAYMVIAEINPQMPRTYGDGFVHMKDIDYYVFADRTLMEYRFPEPDEVDMRIAENIVRLMRHKSCLHLGFGTISKAIQRYLAEHPIKNDLGIHSFIITDDLIPLIEKGIVTCRKKNYRPEKIITSLALGSKKLYDFVHNNPYVEFRKASKVCSPVNISKNNRMFSVNEGFQIDLKGQVDSASKAYDFYTGVGDMVDFVRGSAFSKGGKPVIALRSTNLKETRSRIVSRLDAGANVVLPLADLHYVVTEWGVAYLHGKSVRERALELINIAHPKYRQQLLEEIKARHYVYQDQELPLNERGEIILSPKYETTMTTKNGYKVLIRPLKVTDEQRLQDLSYSLSADERYLRYFSNVEKFEHEKMQKEVVFDYQQQMSLGAFVGEVGSEDLVGNCVYYLNPQTNMAEIAVIVRNDWQREGVASLLFSYLTIIAREKSIRGFYGTFLYRNRAILNLLRKIFNNYIFEVSIPENPHGDDEVYFTVKFEKD